MANLLGREHPRAHLLDLLRVLQLICFCHLSVALIRLIFLNSLLVHLKFFGLDRLRLSFMRLSGQLHILELLLVVILFKGEYGGCHQSAIVG